MNDFEHTLEKNNIQLRRGAPEILQLNTGRLCNLTCVHCHVGAGPRRKEIITRETVDRRAAVEPGSRPLRRHRDALRQWPAPGRYTLSR